MTNQHVAPYNPALSLLMNCHVNVEYVASIKAIEYFFQYQLKGSDQATISIKPEDSKTMVDIALFQNK